MFYHLFIWMLPFFLYLDGLTKAHPFFMSTTEIEFNNSEKRVEISCKIFSDDFEKTLRMHETQKIDLLNPGVKKTMNKVVENYLKNHLKININGKDKAMEFLGFEQEEETIISYLQISDIAVVNDIQLQNDLLYEYSSQQMNIVHVIVHKQRKSHRLMAPDKTLSFHF